MTQSGPPDGGGEPVHLPWERLVVLRALGGLGDLLCSVPALRALRAALPRSHIAVIAAPGSEAVLARFPHYLDEIITSPGYPGLGGPSDGVPRLLEFLVTMQERRWDAALQMHGSGVVSNPLLALLGARQMAGFHLPGQWCPDEERFFPYPSHEPEVRRWLLLMQHLGIPAVGEHLEFPLTEADREDLAAAMAGGAPDDPPLQPGAYAVVHPGAAHPPRRWPGERFARVVDALAERGLRVVVTGTGAEDEVASGVAAAAAAPATLLAGRTSLGGLGALVAGARLVVCNDTGISHLAAALGTPSVVVFTWSDPLRWAPLDRGRHRVVAQASAERNPCRHGEVVRGHRCLGDGCVADARTEADLPRTFASVDEVMAETDALLVGGSADAA